MTHKFVRTVSVAASLVASAACSTDRATAPVRLEPTAPSLAVTPQPTGTYLVQYKGGVSAARTLVTAAGAKVVREIPSRGIFTVSGLSATAAAALAARPGVTMVVQDQLISWIPSPKTLVPGKGFLTSGPATQGTDQSSAFFYNQYQWNMKVTQANVAWNISKGGLGETVCVLDTGVDPNHNDLIGKVDPTRSGSLILVPRFPSDTTVLDYNFHGTFVSAVVSSNGRGVASTAPDAKLCALKVLSQDGNGTFGDVIYAIFVAGTLGADVINMSLGALVDLRAPGVPQLVRVLEEVIDEARIHGSLVVAAAGNMGLNLDDYPSYAHIPSMVKGVISVGATGPINQTNFDHLASYSNYGWPRTLDLVAPGGEFIPGQTVTADLVISACSQYQVTLPFTCAANSYVFGDGTSFAAPMVSGAGAVVESDAPGGTMPTRNLEQCILTTADKVGPKWKFGNGRLNVARAAVCS